MTATIKAVAKVAGVSPSTVSRALQNNPRISEAVRSRIRQIADDMGFRPNPIARSLVSRETRVIGVVFPADLSESLAHPFYPKVLQGLGQAAAKRNYYMLMGTGQEGQTTADVVRLLEDSGYVSGLVLLAAEKGFRPSGSLPMVTIGRPGGTEKTCCVDNDNISAGREAAQYLIRRGHKKIMLLGWDSQYAVTIHRRVGFEQALQENGLPLREDWIIPTRFLDKSTDQSSFRAVFQKEDRPTAVVCMDDAQAIALSACLDSLGLKVPGDVSLISFNNTEAGRLHNPPLTSFDVNPHRLGTAAMDMLLDILGGQDAPSCVDVPFLLMERESVARL